jgi:hypothetical protein
VPSAATQTWPRFRPGLGRPGHRGHPHLRCVAVLDHGFVRFDPSGHAGSGWVAVLEMTLANLAKSIRSLALLGTPCSKKLFSGRA